MTSPFRRAKVPHPLGWERIVSEAALVAATGVGGKSRRQAAVDGAGAETAGVGACAVGTTLALLYPPPLIL